jgi:hypothetical protein
VARGLLQECKIDDGEACAPVAKLATIHRVCRGGGGGGGGGACF